MKISKNARVYYAHSMQDYDSLKEQKEFSFLQKRFSNLLCPNQHIGETTKGINVYLNIVRWAEMLVCSEFQGYIGKGVFAEIQTAFKNNIPVMILRKNNSGNGYRLFDVKEMELTNRNNWIFYAKIKT